MLSTDDVCKTKEITNTANFHHDTQGEDSTNSTLVDSAPNGSDVSVTTTFTKKLPSAELKLSGPTYINPGVTGAVYTITVTNPSSMVLKNATAELLYPEIEVNGMVSKPSMQVLP